MLLHHGVIILVRFVVCRTDVAFSPDDRLVITGTSVDKGSTDYGSLVFLDRENLQKVYDLPVVEGEVSSMNALRCDYFSTLLFIGRSGFFECRF